jgi:uncharacterized repeat protein (TIGR03803 family)
MALLRSRQALSLGLAAVLLAGCGGSPPVSSSSMSFAPTLRGLQGAYPRLGGNYKLLYSFTASPDGFQPAASLTDVKGLLYGTTDAGGANNAGTVFKITTSGAENVVYSFKGGNDGKYPFSNLVYVNGTFYGTTQRGGDLQCNPYGCGTVFAVSTSGKERVLYRFKGGHDGSDPLAGLLWLNGYLYGTATGGGGGCSGGGCGVVFAVSTAGKEQVVYKFKGGVHDGETPEANLIAINGTLYGTTYAGGSHSCGLGSGCGVVFSVSRTGNERVVHDFSGVDGANPESGLIIKNGTLYGTTVWGGSGSCNGGEGYHGCGTVFSITPSGDEHVVYNFKGGVYGITANPQGALVAIKDSLYGATRSGGSCQCGTVFRVSTSGHERVIYKFKGAPDGAYPSGGLMLVADQLYGTTQNGGSSCISFAPRGCGTVFRISP